MLIKINLVIEKSQYFFIWPHIYTGKDVLNTHPLIVEDCTVIYARSKNAYWGGGRLFNMRAKGGGSGGDTITFRDK